VFCGPFYKHLSESTTFLCLFPRNLKQFNTRNHACLLSTLSHAVQHGNTKGPHLQFCCEFPHAEKKTVLWNLFPATLIIDLAGINEVLEAAKYLNSCVWNLEYILNFILAFFGQLLAEVWGLCAEKVFLNTKHNFVRPDEKDDKVRMRFTGIFSAY